VGLGTMAGLVETVVMVPDPGLVAMVVMEVMVGMVVTATPLPLAVARGEPPAALRDLGGAAAPAGMARRMAQPAALGRMARTGPESSTRLQFD